MAVYALGDDVPVLPAEGHYWMAPGAHVVGRVSLAHDVNIWFGAVIRGDREDITVGPETNIQDGAMLHADPGFPLVIGRACTIGHHAIVHGCLLGDHVLVGMGATVMNGAVIGAESIVGAGALVTEGKSFPARSLILGSPAKLARMLDDEAIEGLRRTAQSYVENGRRFAAGLRRLDDPRNG